MNRTFSRINRIIWCYWSYNKKYYFHDQNATRTSNIYEGQSKPVFCRSHVKDI